MVEGQLKLIDFGIAKAISSDTTSIARESQVSLTHNGLAQRWVVVDWTRWGGGRGGDLVRVFTLLSKLAASGCVHH